MAVNLDRPHLWKQDTQASVDHYNKWFVEFAPQAFCETRVSVTKSVKQSILDSMDMRDLSPQLVHSRPGILQILRMSCCPPLTVERLANLANTGRSLVHRIETGRPPATVITAN